MIGLTKTLAKEWGRYKVNVNAVAFGWILTRMTEAVAADDSFVEIDGRKIKVGISAEQFAARASRPRSRSAVRARPRKPPERCTCCAARNPTTSTASASSSTRDASNTNRADRGNEQE